ncbi:unnamed protein product [Alternaria burnsii]|nr:unnamed protein product [Alternaria burnsii]
MADPFSITGSAVGVVSLAIQLCKGLEWYVSGVKDAKDKAEKIAANTEELTNLLELLETIVAKVDPSQSVSTTLTGIASCAEAIATIRKKLKLDDQAANGGIKSSLKRLGKRMAFPFKEAEVEYWKGVLNTIQQSLQTALLALVLDQQRLASEDRIVFDKTQMQLAGHSQIVERGFTTTAHSIHSVHADVHRIQDTLQPIMSLPQIVSKLEHLDAKLSEVTLATDSTLGTDMMNLKSLNRKNQRLKRRLAKVTCTCRTHTSAFGYWSSWLKLACTRTSIHDPQCPLSLLQNTVTNLQLQATLYSLILRSRVSLSLALAYGAGFSIDQNLEYHRVVSIDSPAFSLIPDLVKSSSNTTEEVFCGEVDKLLEIFQQGQASPHDRLCNGMTLLHHLSHTVGTWFAKKQGPDYVKNICYLFLTLLARMSAEAFETDDYGLTCVDRLLYLPWYHRIDTRLQISKALFNHGLQIGQRTLWNMTHTSYYSIWFAEFSAEGSPDPLFNDSALVEAAISRSDHQLRYCLRQSEDSQTLDVDTVVHALGVATVTGWIDGCKIMLEADVMATLNQDFTETRYFTLLGSSAGTNRLEMVQLWLSHRANFALPQLKLIGYAEDMLDVHKCGDLLEYNKDIFRDVAFYLLNLRQEIRLLVEKHEIEYCCDSARSNIPDAHLECMLNALLSKGVKVPQHYWPRRKSLYHRRVCWCFLGRLMLETYEREGFCEISGEHFTCSMKTACSPLIYFLTQSFERGTSGKTLTERDVTVRWFLSKGADLRETWPGSNTTALHCLGWQSADFLEELDAPWREWKPHRKWKLPMESSWDYDAFELLVQEEILDSCECGCSSSGCAFLTCFWKRLFADTWWFHTRFQTRFPAICDCIQGTNPMGEVKGIVTRPIWERQHDEPKANLLLVLTVWVGRAADTLKLHPLIHGYMRLFVFSYLELRHTCCDIGRIEHRDHPDYRKQPYPRYCPKEERRIKNEDARLREILEELVPMFISQSDAVGGTLLEFVVDVMIPKMREVAKELKKEDAAFYAQGRRELGVVMYEDEDDAEQSESGEEEEEQVEDIEEESDDEY